jgi:hypothetical protein
MSVVRGENVLVHIYDGGQWKPYACGTDCTLSVATDFIETSVTGSGRYAEFEPTKNSFTGSITGFTTLDKANHLTLSDLRAMQLAHVKFLLRYQRTDNDGNVYSDQGYFFISNSSDSGPQDALNVFTIELKGTGELVQDFVPTPINPSGKVKRLEYSGIGGESSFTSALLIAKDVIEVVKDGMGRSELITVGTANNNQAKYTSATGTITFAIEFAAGEKAYVLYQDL